MFEIKDVKADGSCFYRSIYHAAKVSNVLDKLVHCFLNKEVAEYENDEEKFVTDIRNILGYKIENELDNGIIHDIFENISSYDSETYKAVLESMPSWFQKEFKKKPKKEDIFRKAFVKRIKDKKSWASETDIRVFTHIFNKCVDDFSLVILNTEPDKKFKPSKKTLYLVNIGEVHYNYLEIIPTSGSRSRSRSNSSSNGNDTSKSKSQSKSNSSEIKKLLKLAES